ncbi:HD domain-containing protein [Candidatus Woesearchaeota archaeon]|nr:HD domain-containing protein [Candidatus Woesearchaeota archaeon]
MYKKNKKIIDLVDGEEVRDIFVVKFKKPIQKYTNGYRFDLRIGDSSREIMLKYWGSDNLEEVQKLYDTIDKDSVIYVEGVARIYRNQLEINATIIKPLSNDEYDPEAFIEKSPRSREELLQELKEFVGMIRDEKLKLLVEELLLSDSEIAKRFTEWPAAMYKHHNYKHGLLEHSLNVAKIAMNIADIHELDSDLIIVGSLLHDIGKIYEFEMTNNIRHTRLGQLVGHVTLGAEIVSRAMDRLDIDENIKLKILHIVLSHHGSLEYGSPKEPMFPEALAVYLADLMDSQIFQMRKKKLEAMTEDDFLYTKDFGNIYLR